MSFPNNLKTMLIMSLMLISLLAISLTYEWSHKGLQLFVAE